MTWEEYYNKFYNWSESTQIKRLSSVNKLGASKEVAEIMQEFAFNHEEIVNRIARKAIEEKLIFSGEDLADLNNLMDAELQKKLVLQSSSSFKENDLEALLGCIDDEILAGLYKEKGYKIPDEWAFIDDNYLEEDYDYEIVENNTDEFSDGKKPSGFFSKLAMAFAIGHGIRQGINNAAGTPVRKFRIGDHVRVKHRGQEGTVIDINGDLYMVSLKNGAYVDSYTEGQLERFW